MANNGWGEGNQPGSTLTGSWGSALMTPSGPASQSQTGGKSSGWGENWGYNFPAQGAPPAVAFPNAPLNYRAPATLEDIFASTLTPWDFQFMGLNVKDWARNEYTNRFMGKPATLWDEHDAAIYSLNFNSVNNQLSLAGDYNSWPEPARIALQNPKAQGLIQQAKDNNCEVTYSHLSDDSQAVFNVYATTLTRDRGMVGTWAFSTVTGQLTPVQPGQGAIGSVSIPSNVPIIRTGQMFQMIDTYRSGADFIASAMRTPVVQERISNKAQTGLALSNNELAILREKFPMPTAAERGGEFPIEFGGEKGTANIDDENHYVFTSPTGEKTVLGRFAKDTEGKFNFEEGQVKEGEFQPGIWQKEQTGADQWVDTGRFIPGTFNPVTGQFESEQFLDEAAGKSFLGGAGSLFLRGLNVLAWPARQMVAGRLEEGITPRKVLSYNPLALLYEKAVHLPLMEAVEHPAVSAAFTLGGGWIPSAIGAAILRSNPEIRKVIKEDKEAWDVFKSSPTAYAALAMNRAEAKGVKFEQDYFDLVQFTPFYMPWREPYIEMLNSNTMDVVLEKYRADHPIETIMAQMSVEFGYDPLNYLLLINAPVTGLNAGVRGVSEVAKIGEVANIASKVTKGTQVERLVEAIATEARVARGIKVPAEAAAYLSKTKLNLADLVRYMPKGNEKVVSRITQLIDEIDDLKK